MLSFTTRGIFVWDSSNEEVTISTNPDDYPPGALRKISYANAETDDAWGDYLTVDTTNEKICVSSTTGAHLWNYDGTGYVNIDKAGTGTGGIADDFGKICACGDGKVAIGNPNETKVYGSRNDTNAGAVYVYNLDGTGEFKIQPSANALTRAGTENYNAYDILFGYSVAISNGRIVVGAPGGSQDFIRYYHGEVFTYKLDGTGETWHFAEDPDDASDNYGDGVTSYDRMGYHVAAKNGKFVCGSSECDEQTSSFGTGSKDKSGVIYHSSIPGSTSAGEYIMAGTYKDWAYNDLFQRGDMFGHRSNIGTYRARLSNGGSSISSLNMVMAPGTNRIYYKTTSFVGTGYWSSVTVSLSEYDPAHEQPPFDGIERHILVGNNHASGNLNGALYAERLVNDVEDNWQMMPFPPIL